MFIYRKILGSKMSEEIPAALAKCHFMYGDARRLCERHSKTYAKLFCMFL